MNNHMINQKPEEIVFRDLYSAQLANVFQKSLRFISFPSFLIERGWLFVSDQSGRVLASKKIRKPCIWHAIFLPASRRGRMESGP